MPRFFLIFKPAFALAAVAVLVGIGLVATIPQPASGAPSRPAAGIKTAPTTIVRASQAQREDITQAARARGLAMEREFSLPGGETLITLEGTPATVQMALRASPATMFQSIETYPNRTYKATQNPSDTQYQNDEQWNLAKLKAEEAWGITTGSENVTVAVLDSGILYNQQWGEGESAQQYTHPDIDELRIWENPDETADGTDSDGNNYIDDTHGWDFMGGWRGDDGTCPNYNDSSEYEHPDDSEFLTDDNDPQPYSCDSPDEPTVLNKDHYDGSCEAFSSACYVGHGTAVGSVATAATDNATYIAGIDWQSEIMNLRIFDGYGFTTTDRLIAALEYADDKGADVANMSLAIFDSEGSCDITDTALENTLETTHSNGLVSVAASGNEYQDHVCYPASSEYVIAVGASDKNDERADFSNYGDKLDVVAPGLNVPALNAPSARNENESYLSSGTSLATPHVVGAAALIKGQFPEATFNEVETNLQKGVDKVPQMNGQTKTKEHGYGRLSLHKSTKHADTPQPDGMLVSIVGSPHIYWLENGEKRRILNPAVLNSHNFQGRKVLRSTLTSINLPTGSPLRLREGTLLQAKDDTKIYIVDHESGTVQKRHIGSPSVFSKLGFSGKEVMKVRKGYLPDENGPSVSSAKQHPDGVLISPEGRPHIYLIEDGQRRHVVSPPVLKSHRFQGGVKEATSGDMNLASGPRLHLREGTLVKDDEPPIYVVNYASDGTVEKRHIKTLFIYRLLDLNASKVLKVSSSTLPNQDGEPIN